MVTKLQQKQEYRETVRTLFGDNWVPKGNKAGQMVAINEFKPWWGETTSLYTSEMADETLVVKSHLFEDKPRQQDYVQNQQFRMPFADFCTMQGVAMEQYVVPGVANKGLMSVQVTKKLPGQNMSKLEHFTNPDF